MVHVSRTQSISSLIAIMKQKVVRVSFFANLGATPLQGSKTFQISSNFLHSCQVFLNWLGHFYPSTRRGRNKGRLNSAVDGNI